MLDRNDDGNTDARDEDGSTPVKRGPTRLEVDGAQSGQRLDRFLKHRFAKLPHGLVHKLLRKRDITVNRSRARADTRLAGGDSVEVWTDTSGWVETSEDRHARVRGVRRSETFRRRFRVLHEDESLIALDKASGTVVHPGPQHHDGDTLLDLLRAHLPDHFARSSDYRPGFVHRLDRGTSGVIIAAKTREAAKGLERSFRRGETRKVYLAVVHGRMKQRDGEIDLSLVREESRGPTRYQAANGPDDNASPGARRALTRYVTERELHGATLLRVTIGTGRTHQIRVHLASLGSPIIGDGDYGKRDVNQRYRDTFGLSRLFLHAAELEIPHPVGGEPLLLRAPLPALLTRVLDGLGPGRPSRDSRPARTRRRPGD